MIARGVVPTLAAAILITGAGTAAAEISSPLAPLPAFDETPFGPQYVIEDVRVTGNRKTERSLIAGELAALGLAPGRPVDASDRRVETARYRLLSLGYFLDVHLSVARGSRRGAVVLIVDVEERGTLVINEIFAATSPATFFWGGTDLAQTNFMGRGINVGAGFVASTQPLVANAHAGLGLRLHVAVPPLGGPNGVALSVTGLYNDASEFYRASGEADDSDPGRFVATRVRRIGGMLTAGLLLPANFHASVSFREEQDSAQLPLLRVQMLPDGRRVPIDFMIREGASRVGSATGSLQFDNRSDPVLPRSGARAVCRSRSPAPLLGSSYDVRQRDRRGVDLLQDAARPCAGPASVRRRHQRRRRRTSTASSSGTWTCCCRAARWGSTSRRRRRQASWGRRSSTTATTTTRGASWSSTRSRSGAGAAWSTAATRSSRSGCWGWPATATSPARARGAAALPIDLTGDVGLRLDTYVGVFTISIANALSRASF